MFRRIEFISKSWKLPEDGYFVEYWFKSGLMGANTSAVCDAYMPDEGPILRGPWGKRNRSIPRNARFYFTEEGWDKIGRNVLAAAIKDGRIIAVKETDAAVCWRDSFTGFEVAIQPKKKRK